MSYARVLRLGVICGLVTACGPDPAVGTAPEDAPAADVSDAPAPDAEDTSAPVDTVGGDTPAEDTAALDDTAEPGDTVVTDTVAPEDTADQPDGDTSGPADTADAGPDDTGSGPDGWVSVHPPSRLNADLLAALVPPGSSDWYAVGNTVAVSGDEGQSWAVAATDSLPRQPRPHVCDVVYVSPDDAFYACGDTLYATSDRGATWEVALQLQRSHPDYSDSASINALDFPSPEVGFLVGGFDKILKTVDGGETWMTLRWSDSTTPYRSYSDVVFLDPQVGYVAGYEVADILMNFAFDERILVTVDGGQTWVTHSLGVGPDYKGVELQVLDAQHLFARMHRTQSLERVFASEDGGVTWTERTADAGLDDIGAMVWLAPDRGLVFGGDAQGWPHLLRTSDGGASWDEAALPFGAGLREDTVLDMTFVDGQRGFAVGQGGAIAVTADAGQTWSQGNPGQPELYSIGFVSDELGYASAGVGYYRTTDGGVSWEYAAGSESMYVMDTSVGPAGAYFGGVRDRVYALDPATGEVTVSLLPAYFLFHYAMAQSPDALLLAGRASGPDAPNVLMVSDDGAASFEVHEIDVGEGAVVDIDHRSGRLFATTTGELLVSDDGGDSWVVAHDFSPDVPARAAFFDDQVGVVTLADGRLLRTADGGESWVTVDDTPRFVTGIVAADATTMHAVGSVMTAYGSVGAAWRSEDAGLTWVEEPLPVRVASTLRGICASPGYVYTTGGNGEVLRISRPD